MKKDAGSRDDAFLSGSLSDGRSTTDPFGVLENRCERSDMVFIAQAVVISCSKRSRTRRNEGIRWTVAVVALGPICNDVL